MGGELFCCCLLVFFLKRSCECLDLISVENINFWGNIEGSDILCVSLCNKGCFFSGAKEKVLERDFIEITAHL